ncbi:MtrAB system accessory lipoprotein LpqB [Corynebacterium sp. CNCTC7651]|uniref:MtrAB system accessory lipoprotein LpqB n=1 Tax=Corynebacterium sp. CNCTC7651 TaxID=2815361 RepID=UPI001F2040D2|nr:MtrAB system accessory lipoprotein LpqB [Corynebacterium sp. CNCTC7651]
MNLKRLPGALVALATTGALAAGCASLPSTSDPHVLRPYTPQASAAPVVTPEDGKEPDLLLRDFYAASAIPSSDYEAARAFMTQQASAAWDPTDETLVVDRIGVNTLPGGTLNRRSFSVHGNVVGVLGQGGSFRPERGTYEATIEMEQVAGQWRISSLPAGVVLERTELRNQYQPFNLYFFDARGQELVTDRRWLFTRRETLPSALISLILEGPAKRLLPAVPDSLPAEVSYTGYEDGAYLFSGFGAVREDERTQFAAQVVWTLASAGISGPYTLLADGAPLVPNAETLTTDDFVELSPLVQAAGTARLYSLTDGRISLIDGGVATPLDGELGNSGSVQTAEITASGNWVAVLGGTGEAPAVIRAGVLGDEGRDFITATTFTRPSFEARAAAVWTVADGTRILRSVRSAATGEVTTEEIFAEMPDGVTGNISVLRLSRSGARVVMVVDGHLYTGIVERRATGERAIVNVLEYASELGGSVVAADWQPDGSLIVGTSSSVSPVLRVEQDGSSATALSVGNISAPVVAVAASPGMLYVTDANAVLQLPSTGSDNPLWREVPGLEGVRALPIVAK